MEKSTLLAALTMFTLLSGMGVAAYQLWAVEKAKKDPKNAPGSFKSKSSSGS